MKEIIKHWYEHPNEVSLEDAIIVIREYCRIYGNRTVSDEELRVLLHIHEHGMPIRFEKLLKYICIHYGYNVRELWSQPDANGNRRLICCYFDD